MTDTTGGLDSAGAVESNRTYAPNLIVAGDLGDVTTLDSLSSNVAIVSFDHSSTGSFPVTDDRRKLTTTVAIKVFSDFDSGFLSSPLFGDFVINLSIYKTGDLIYFQPYMISAEGDSRSVTFSGTPTTGELTVYTHYQALEPLA